MYQRIGYYLQMVAAFLLLSLTHYFAAGFLPIADCDETFNFIEPIHYLLYGSGKQTWELCSQYALRSWLFSWMYAWPAVFIRGAASLSSADVYFYLRIFNGRIAGLAELFFVYSVWSAFSGTAAMVTLLLLLVNYPIPHAAVSVLPTSLVMVCNFVVLGCWLRTRAWTAKSSAAAAAAVARTRATPTAATTGAATSSGGAGGGSSFTAASSMLTCAPSPSRRLHLCVALALFFSVFAGVTGWPFAGLVSVPVGLDLLLRFPKLTLVFMAVSFTVVAGVGILMDHHYYCRWMLSGWNVVLYNVFGGADRGPDLFDVEPWFFFWKNLTLNFHLLFVAALLAPLMVLMAPRSRARSDVQLNGSFPRGEPMRRFTSGDDVRGSGVQQILPATSASAASGAATVIGSPSSPTSPLLRSRLHVTGTPERRSPLMSGRHHAHLTLGSVHGHVGSGSGARGFSRGRELLYLSPFYVWFAFWMLIAHKEERFMAPAYPFLVLAATRAICFSFFPDVDGESREGTPTTLAAAAATSLATSSAAQPGSPTSADPTTALLGGRQRSSRSVSPHAFTSATALALRRAAGLAFFVLFFLLSYSRAMAVYTFYSGPERIFYDWYPVLRAEALQRWEEKKQTQATTAHNILVGTTAQQTKELNAYFTLCVGREWYRFPSSFFVDHRYTRYQFLNTSYFHGMLPVSFLTGDAGREHGFLTAAKIVRDDSVKGSCGCGAPSVNDRNREVHEQYVQDPTVQCDAIFDSLSPPTHVSEAQHQSERAERFLDTVFTRSLLNTTAMRAVLAGDGAVYHHVDDAYAVMDVDRTPLWCRVLYYPFGISKRCAAWRPLVLNARP